MKRSLYTLLCLLHVFSIGKVYARDELIKKDMQAKLGWELSDASQKRIAVGMTVAGVFLFLAAGFISGYVPHSVGDSTPFDDPDNTNTIVGN